MDAKPIKTQELCYPMSQFLIIIHLHIIHQNWAPGILWHSAVLMNTSHWGSLLFWDLMTSGIDFTADVLPNTLNIFVTDMPEPTSLASLTDNLLARHAIFPPQFTQCVTSQKSVCEGGYNFTGKSEVMCQSIPSVAVPCPWALLGYFSSYPSRVSGISPPRGIWQAHDFHPTALSLPFSDKFISKDEFSSLDIVNQKWFVIDYVSGGKN